MNKLTDEALINLILKDDKDAFSELISRYEKQIYSLAYRLTNNPDDAQDLAQEAFCKIYVAINKYDKERPFFPWMYKVASNVFYSSLRSEKGKSQEISIENIIDFTPMFPSTESHPEESLMLKEVQEMVQKAIAELPEKYRVPIVLKYLEELSYKNIAEILELPVTTIETRLYRGKILLQKRLEKIMEGGERHEMSRE